MEKTKKTGILVECSVLIAMAFVLSFIKIIDIVIEIEKLMVHQSAAKKRIIFELTIFWEG